MKLFIFEPYNWDYCGGAIGIVAETYEDAVNLIVEESRQEATKSAEEAGPSKYQTFEESVEMRTMYKKEHFSDTTDNLDSSYGGNWSQWGNQWLLTHTFEVPKEKEAKVAFNNWNYA